MDMLSVIILVTGVNWFQSAWETHKTVSDLLAFHVTNWQLTCCHQWCQWSTTSL